MSWGAIAAGAAAVIGGVIASNGAKDAANTQVKGGQKAIDAQTAAQLLARGDLAPYRETGGQALNALSQGLGLEGYYPGVTKPLSFEEWSAKNGATGAPGAAGSSSGNYGLGADSGAMGMLSGVDPLGVFTGGERSVKRALDPLNISSLFGGGKKKPKPVAAAGAPGAPGTATDPRAAYADYVKGFQAQARPETGTATNDFNRDFTAADFEKDPGYQFRMDEGANALQGANAATRGVQNGRTMRELERYGQDYASGEFSNAYNRFNADRNTRFNRLASLAGVGQTATNTGIAANQNSANNISENIVGQANAAAAGRVGQANAINSGVQTLGNLYLNRQYGVSSPKSIPTTNTGSSYQQRAVMSGVS